jgi:hypothetical protein
MGCYGCRQCRTLHHVQQSGKQAARRVARQLVTPVWGHSMIAVHQPTPVQPLPARCSPYYTATFALSYFCCAQQWACHVWAQSSPHHKYVSHFASLSRIVTLNHFSASRQELRFSKLPGEYGKCARARHGPGPSV